MPGLRPGDRLPALELVDSGGDRLSLGAADHPTVLALLGTELPGEPGASLIVERLAELPARLPRQPIEVVAAPLAPLVERPAGPIFLAIGPTAPIRELAVELGVLIAHERDGWTAGHAVVVADTAGRIVSIFRGARGWTAAELAHAVARAAAR